MHLSFPIFHCPTVWHVFILNLVLKELLTWLMNLQSRSRSTHIYNMNTQVVETFNSSNSNLHGVIPISVNNFSDVTDAIQESFNFIGHQSSVYDTINHFPTMVDMFGVPRDGVIPPVESFLNSDLPVFGPEFVGQTKGQGGRKRKRTYESHVEKPREVVHVRAKRGEATDSHSLAERMRREKINEKLRRLQDLVPGCYKTMGMSVMLDVIINYVRSLQNQIEFLSMKLSAASMFYDFNSVEMDDMGTMKGTNGHEAQVMERMVEEGYGDYFPRFQSTP